MDKLLCLDNYLEFECKCEKCRHTCCGLWKIPVNKKDYNRITGLRDKDERINDLFGIESFTTSSRYAYIKLGSDGYCKCLKDGLCDLQCKLGFEALTTVCIEYPRLVRYINSPEIALSGACEGVVELLMKDKPSCFKRVDKSYMNGLSYSKNQKFIHGNSIRSKCLSSDVCNIPAILGFELDTSFSKEYLGYLKALYDELFRKRADMMAYPNILDGIKYEDIVLNDNTKISNLIVNHMFYMNFPYCNYNDNIKDNYIGLLAIYRLIQIAFSILSGDELVDYIAFIFRMAEHSNYYAQASNIYYEVL